MEISFFGANCVRLTGRDISVLCDPYPKSAGLPEIKVNADATLLTAEGTELPAKPGMVIDGPGEYEVKGAQIVGVPVRLHIDEEGHRGTIYSVRIDGVRVGVLGNIAPGLSNEQMDALGQIDVLVVPIGGHGLTLDVQAAAEMVSQLEPKYVLPVHYDDGKTKYEMPQDKLEAFLKEVGSNPEPVARLKVAEKDLPLETTIVVLQRQGG